MKHFPTLLPATLLLLVIVTSCGSHRQPAEAGSPKQDSSVSNKFFPVADWLRSEIVFVDSTPLAIMQYSTINNKKDSTFLTPAQFHRLASQFLLPGLETDSLQHNFSENSFFDKTTGYLTFTYSTRNKELPLQRVDVLAQQGEISNKVKSVYLESYTSQGDTLVIKKMFWTARHDFLIITNFQQKGRAPVQEQLKVVWDGD